MVKSFFTLLFFTISVFGFSQNNTLFCEQITALQQLVETKHFSPKILNDSLSLDIQKLFINALDPDKDYFFHSDIEAFKKEAYKFDDYIKNNNCDFELKYTSALKNRITLIKTKLNTIRTVNLDYSGNQTLQYTPEKELTYYKDEASLERRLRKRVSYKVILNLLDEHDDINYIKANFSTLEKVTKQTVIDNEICLLEELLNKDGGLDYFVKASFLNALVQVNDPNSSFFNSSEKTTYESQLSTSQMSFGIVTKKNNNGEIIIAHVIPGSVAFENGKFEKNDVLKSLISEQSTLNISCISNDDIALFLNKEANKTLTFSIKKKNGTIQNIKLTKSKIKVNKNAITGYLINNKHKLGYIKIPSFYTNYESPNGRGLTADIAKELYKLQKENITGLILDLRFNGGGSLQEAIELSGMFIDRGPVSIIKAKNEDNYTVLDRKRGSFYSKPLLVLVNEYSASASEFFAAAMQDYNRAIIVGTTTYGKSSAQTILPLSKDKTLGFSKLTIEAFYRVSGESHQSIGVVPDIKLPSLYRGFEIAENSSPHALKNTSTKVSFKHKALSELKIDSLKFKSASRLSNDKNFQNIIKRNQAFYNLIYKKGEQYKLTLENISKEKKRREEKINFIFQDTNEESELLLIENTKSTLELLEYNANDKEQNKALIKNISQDIYINEAQHILTQSINLMLN